jgi:hypothetical protein
MKGVIALALKGLVVNKFGEAVWKTVLGMAGIEREPLILPMADVDDPTVLKIIDAVCKTAGMSLQEAGMAFGDYWVNTYSQTMYGSLYKRHTHAKDFLLAMDDIHSTMTMSMRNATPPKFEYQWRDDKTLVMKYISKRGLLDIMVGLVHGVAKFYNEKLKVEKLGNDQVVITFP